VNTWDIIQVFLILGIMVAVMYGLLYLVKKYFYSFEKKGGVDSRISILSTQAILPKKYVSVVKFNDSVYLLGVSDHSVNLIDKLDSNYLDENNDSNNQIEKPNFLKLLKQNMGIK
jgi:flagellar biosynthetic protein FliO